jgi:hypothetical protein
MLSMNNHVDAETWGLRALQHMPLCCRTFNQETVNRIFFGMFQELITGLAAESLEVSNRSRVCREYLQRPSGGHFFQCFSGFQDG